MRAVLAALAVVLLAGPVAGALAADAGPAELRELVVPEEAMCELRERWAHRLLAEHAPGTWAPMRMELADEDLALLGLPPRDVLLAQRYPQPTMLLPDGTTRTVDLGPSVATGTLGPTLPPFAGTGCLGIRPGGFLLLLNDGAVGWCSLAHVYGAPGSYTISTAGHCGKVGDVATMVAVFGDRDSVANPVLLDFGKFAKSTDGGIGKDWALVSVDPEWQGLVSPTMCFWGGPTGAYTKTGATLAASWSFGSRGPRVSSPTVDPDPLLAQAVVHYGHGTGLGPGGTPRAGTAFHWGTETMIWEGAISPGDSGSGSNTLGGDAVGAVREAAGINTHIFVDPTLKTGIGFMASTRVTVVGTPADGQLVPYPAPVPGAP